MGRGWNTVKQLKCITMHIRGLQFGSVPGGEVKNVKNLWGEGIM